MYININAFTTQFPNLKTKFGTFYNKKNLAPFLNKTKGCKEVNLFIIINEKAGVKVIYKYRVFIKKICECYLLMHDLLYQNCNMLI